jgi:hypothetical protein
MWSKTVWHLTRAQRGRSWRDGRRRRRRGGREDEGMCLGKRKKDPSEL